VSDAENVTSGPFAALQRIVDSVPSQLVAGITMGPVSATCAAAMLEEREKLHYLLQHAEFHTGDLALNVRLGKERAALLGVRPSVEYDAPCPNCEAREVGTYTADQSFLYGTEYPVRLTAKDVEHFRCMKCELEFTGRDGEQKRLQAVQEHLAAVREDRSQCNCGYGCPPFQGCRHP
jgi:hypothetical protein